MNNLDLNKLAAKEDGDAKGDASSSLGLYSRSDIRSPSH